MRFRKATRFVLLLAVLALIAAACGDDAADDTTTTAAPEDTTTTAAPETTTAAPETTTTTAAETTTTVADACATENLPLTIGGQLTVATGEPVFPPWMGVGDDNFDVPESGTGFEGALVYALAEELGFSADQVVFVRTGFDEAITAGPKDWDFNIQQYSIREDRDEVVDFSDPYYTTRQSLITFPDSAFAAPTSLDDLKAANLGVAIGTTSFDFVENVIQTDSGASVYDDTAAAVAAMQAGQIDGLVVDLPTAYFVTAVQVEGAIIAAQFGADAAEPDNYGMLFSEGSELVDCVNEALATLRDDGTLAALEAEWLTQGGDIPTVGG